jgi:hypothetical protein
MITTELKTELEPGRVVRGCATGSRLQYIWALIFSVTLCVGIAVLRHLTLPTLVRYIIPFVPLLTGAQYLLVMVSDNRRQQDELQLRIYLEAAMVVVCGLFVLMLCYPLLEAANLIGPLDSYEVLVMIVILGAVGYFSAYRRYR